MTIRFGSVAIRPCPTYILEQGCTAGCVLEVEPNEDGDRDLEAVFLLFFLVVKPGSLNDLKFLWKQEEVTVTCPELPYEGLLYEVQYKNKFDSGWQSTEEEDRCRVTIESLDADKCYYFRARVKTVVSSYGSGTYPSDWSEVMHWQSGKQRDACGQEKVPFPKSVLISCLMALLILCFLLFVFKLQRVKKVLMPNVPDPKFTFPGLFEDHKGNFQEWIKDTQNVTHVNKVENELEDCAPEEMLLTQLIKAENETPTTGPLCPQMDVEKATGPGQHCGPPQSASPNTAQCLRLAGHPAREAITISMLLTGSRWLGSFLERSLGKVLLGPAGLAGAGSNGDDRPTPGQTPWQVMDKSRHSAFQRSSSTSPTRTRGCELTKGNEEGRSSRRGKGVAGVGLHLSKEVRGASG
ncbi:PREDICTED: cytokine receptor-like factor 2 [Chrysochloris asiatica]|uniref:Cytokine receptor-like factor 2 n=1 Tax=Chrysochloris asiatica TaxID=185453 RepID=A0A9B0UA55_CHRAS|nr:PREDICTED: cytokine receptor-like factor 2 [Chrysochloris asiatica]